MNLTVAIDCMGGDFGPDVTVPAALELVARRSNIKVLLVGIEDRLRPLLSQVDTQGVEIVHASEVVGMDESPALAIRNKKDSSMRVAIDLVKEGRAQACVSAGNTGALMAISKFVLRTLPGIDRPAICGILPTAGGHVHVLDLGANVDSSAENLYQFGIMGSCLVSALEHKACPSLGLLNIGSEDIKGNEVVKKAAELLKASGLNFVGNVEGDGIYKSGVDVVVCDGFVGNVALKTSEGLAQMLGSFLKQEFRRSWYSKFAALVALPVLKNFKRRIDHRCYNGACLLGLKGIVVKSHGSADSYSFRHAIERAVDAAQNDVLAKIAERIAQQQSSEEAA